MERLRIAVVTPEFPTREWPHRGRPVYQTVRQLQKYAEIQVFCTLPAYPHWIRPSFDHRRTDLSYSPPDVPTSFIEFPAIPGITRPLNGVTCACLLEPCIQSFRPDVILNYWLYPAGFAAVKVGRKLGVPVIVGSIGSDLNAIGDPVSRWLTRKTMQEASLVITKSQQLRQRALQMGVDPTKVHVVCNGCDADLFSVRDRGTVRVELNVPVSAELIAFVGRMDRAKGIFELLTAFTELSGTRPNLRLLYVGDGPELAPMQAKTRNAGLQDCVHFAGACSPQKVARWLTAANLLVLPSYAEGCPNVIIEALNCGRPIVATNVGGIPELIDSRCGLLVPPHQAGALRNAIEAALTSFWDENTIANHFCRNWDQVAQEVFALCEASRQNANG
jgi:glycosyltransferase involved in cell wall biosynthesis